MHMTSVRALAVVLGLSISAAFAATVPRPSSELVFNYPGGKQALLSQYKGKVVLLAVIYTTCPHCQATCQMLSKLNTELGPKGFQPLALAINDMSLMLVSDFARNFHVNFPVGASERPPALTYLQIDPANLWYVPQIVLIDRKGVIRAQSPPKGDEKLQDENYLRTQIEALLQEGSSTSRHKPVAPKRRAS